MVRFLQIEQLNGDRENWEVFVDDEVWATDFPEMPRIELDYDHPLVVDLFMAEMQIQRWTAKADSIYHQIGKLIEVQEIERGAR